MDYRKDIHKSIYHIEVDCKPLKWNTATSKTFFDEVNKELVAVTADGEILRMSLDGSITSMRVNAVTNDVKAVKFSPDSSYITLQHNDKEIEFIRLSDEARFVVCCKPTRHLENKILQYYWTNNVNFVVVTMHGVHFYALAKPNSYKLVKEFKLAVNWFLYSAGVRILLVSTGPKENTLHGFHFTVRPDTVLKLPKFDVQLPGPKDVLKPNQLTVSQVYSRVYLIVYLPTLRQFHLYQLTKDVVDKKISIDLHASGDVHVSVIDNLIIAHNVTQKVSMIFDIYAQSRQSIIDFPLVAPLPIAPVRTDTDEIIDPYDGWTFHLPRYALDVKRGLLFTLSINLESLCLSFSDRIRLVDFLIRRVDGKQLIIYSLKQVIEEKELLGSVAQIFDMINDVLAIYHAERIRQIRTQSDSPNLSDEKRAAAAEASFQQAPSSGRKPGSSSPVSTPHGSGGSDLVADLSTRRAEHFWAEFKDQQQRDKGEEISNQQRKQKEAEEMELSNQQQLMRQTRTSDGRIVIEQEDMYTQVFLPIEEKGIVDCQYMSAVIGEYIRSLNFRKIKLQSFIYELIIDLLVRNNKFYQLHQLLQYHVIADSLHVACQLLSISSRYPPALQLALDMFKRLNEPIQILEVLLTKGMLQHAMRFIRALPPGIDIKPFAPRFLAAAKQSGDPTLFFLTYQFFSHRGEIDKNQCSEFIEYYTATFNRDAELASGLINGMQVIRHSNFTIPSASKTI